MTTRKVLKNRNASAEVLLARGGLVRQLSLSSGTETKELLWLPDDFKESGSGWPGGGIPFLFPFAGRVWNKEGIEGKWNFSETEYPMPIHGFAYSCAFECIEANDQSIKLSLESNDVSKSIYPFEFRVELMYSLEPDSFGIEFLVHNLENELELPVAVGFHPYFAICDKDSISVSLGAETRYRVHTNGDVSRPEEFESKEYSGNHDKIQNAIFADFGDCNASITFEDGTKLVIEQSASLPFRTVWSKSGESFYCLEPWMSLPNAPGRAHQKVGASLIPPKKSVSGFVKISLV